MQMLAKLTPCTDALDVTRLVTARSAKGSD